MTDRPAAPTSTNVPRPTSSSASGTRTRVGASQVASARPTSPATATGSFTSALRKLTIAVGTSLRPLLRPSSSASPLVWFCEKSGSPVTMKSVPAQISGAAATSSASSTRSRQLAFGNSHSQ